MPDAILAPSFSKLVTARILPAEYLTQQRGAEVPAPLLPTEILSAYY